MPGSYSVDAIGVGDKKNTWLEALKKLNQVDESSENNGAVTHTAYDIGSYLNGTKQVPEQYA